MNISLQAPSPSLEKMAIALDSLNISSLLNDVALILLDRQFLCQNQTITQLSSTPLPPLKPSSTPPPPLINEGCRKVRIVHEFIYRKIGTLFTICNGTVTEAKRIH